MPNIYLNLQPTYLNKQTCIFFVSHTGLLFHKDLFSAAANTSEPAHADVFFPLTQPKQGMSSTQTTQTTVCLTRPTQVNLSTTDIFFPMKQPTQGHLEATHFSRPLSAHSCLQGHLEAPRLPIPYRAHSCPQGHLEAP